MSMPNDINLTRVISSVLANFMPPEDITVSAWADKYRRLAPETSAESGPWRMSRTPYLRDIMDAFVDPEIRRIAVVAPSQTGKTEMELNMLGYAIDIDPAPMLYVMPTLDVAEDFSKRRISSLIRDNERLRSKVDSKSRDSNNTILKKSFPGGMLTITGANSPASLASMPIKYLFGDERDRWPPSAGAEGDPWALAEARTTTFYNAKLVEVSSPTIKGQSAIEASFYDGTQERWVHQCPECKEWHTIRFREIKFEHETVTKNGRKTHTVKSVEWACPSCACLIDEGVMRRQPAKWVAENPEAYSSGFRSFWIDAFSSPWMPWPHIVYRFLLAGSDPEKLKTVYNTVLGELWEDRGRIEDEDGLLARREVYQADLPHGVLVLTMGVDTQDNRLEYEVVGHGLYGETWGVKRGIIMGRPDTPEVWQSLDDLIDKVFYYDKEKRRGLTISMTCIDSGGHYTQEVYRECSKRQNRRVFAVRGVGGDGIPFTAPPRQAKISIKNKYLGLCWFYNLGVDAGKASIMNSLKVQEPGPKYCHFPRGEDRGYDAAFFNGLLSEKLVLKRSKGRDKWAWEKLPGHTRNEALDCRNYALAAFRILDPDMDAVERRINGVQPAKHLDPPPASKPRKRRTAFEDW